MFFSQTLIAERPPTEEEKTAILFVPLWLIQLKIKTYNSQGAGTNDDVYVKLNCLLLGDRFYIDRCGDDLEQNTTKYYYIVDPGVYTLLYMKKLEIGLEGTGDWRLHEVTVYINQDFAPIFSKTWSNGLLLNGGGFRSYLS